MSESSLADSVWGWRGEASGIVQRMKQALETGERSDIQFAVGHQYGKEELFRAHKLVLSLSSDVWDTMFYGEVPETAEIIQLPDILPQAFDIMLKYLYADGIEDLSLGNVLATLYCAKKYGIPKLVDICVEYAIKNVNKATCLTMLEPAQVLGADSVVNKCLKIVDAHCSELLHSQEFLQITNETLRMIFSRDTLFASEEAVYKAAERWASNACRTNDLKPTAANYRRVLGEALFLIRFPLMDDAQLSNGPVASGLLLNEEVSKIYQFKHAAKKPDIPFSDVPRELDIVFCDRQWVVGGNTDNTFSTLATRNAYLDEHGHLHLRLAPHNDAWKGAGIQSTETFGFGRYELHIEGLDELDLNVGFAVSSLEDGEPGVSVNCAKPYGGNNVDSVGQLRFSLHDQNSYWPFGVGVASSDGVTVVDKHLTLSYHRKPDSILFSAQRGFQHNNTAVGEFHNWLYDSKPTISQKPLSVLLFLVSPLGEAPSAGKDAEVIVHSFRFYPDE